MHNRSNPNIAPAIDDSSTTHDSKPTNPFTPLFEGRNMDIPAPSDGISIKNPTIMIIVSKMRALL
jgi:hypothetical protein